MRLHWIGPTLALGLMVSLAGPVGAAQAPTPAAAAPYVSARDDAAPPNVLLILTDDQRANTLVGMPRVMEEIVGQGTTYPNAFVPTSWCCPSRASLLSGKFAHNSGVWENLQASAWGAWSAFANGGEEKDTLATRLHDAGYRTGLFGKYLNDTTAQAEAYLPPGWDAFDAFLGGNYTRYRLSSDERPVRKDRRYLTDALADRTLDVIALSSAEAEYYGLVSATSHLLGEVSLAKDWGMAMSPRIFMDATAGTAIGSQRGLGRVKHIDRVFLWVQQLVTEGRVRLSKVGTDDMLADVLAKHVPEATMVRTIERMQFSFATGRHELGLAS